MKTLRAGFAAMRGQPTFFDRYLPTARSASLLLSVAFLDIGRWDNAEPAAVLESFDVRPSLSVFDADLAAALLVSLLNDRSNRLKRRWEYKASGTGSATG